MRIAYGFKYRLGFIFIDTFWKYIKDTMKFIYSLPPTPSIILVKINLILLSYGTPKLMLKYFNYS